MHIYKTRPTFQTVGLVFNFLFCIGVWLINDVVIVSGGQQRDSAMRIHVSFLPRTPSQPAAT